MSDEILYRLKHTHVWIKIPVLERASKTWIKVLMPNSKVPSWVFKSWKYFRELSYLEGVSEGKPLKIVGRACSKGVRKLARYPDMRRWDR
jgi:hypothetical protein